MFNPYAFFHIKMIGGFREMKRRYLVSQTNVHAQPGFGEDAKECILLTDYDEMGLARVHFNGLTDKFRAILDLENERHRRKIEEMLQPDSKYRLYSAFVEDIKMVERKLNERYSKSIRNYIAKHTHWRLGSDKTIVPKLQLSFGELFVILKYSGQEIRFKVTELDNY